MNNDLILPWMIGYMETFIGNNELLRNSLPIIRNTTFIYSLTILLTCSGDDTCVEVD